MDRREFLAITSAAALEAGRRAAFPNLAQAAQSAAPADFTIRIEPVSVELAPGQIVKTIGYNGTAPGPILRMREDKTISVEVINHTEVQELVHWHGQFVPSGVDGSAEEGTPAVPAHGHRRYTFTPRPAGTRWYHTHAMAGRNLHRGLYSGQFGFLNVEPSSNPGSYDQEVYLALHEWEPFYTNEEEEEEEAGCMRLDGARVELASYRAGAAEKANGLEVGYHRFSINDKALGHGEPIRVKQGERVLMHLLNASATESRRVALPGHKFTVVALDGNRVPAQATVEVLEIGPAERVDAIVDMNQSGVWILGTTNDEDREGGMGAVVEYAGQNGAAQWVAPPKIAWDYTLFGKQEATPNPDETIHLIFKKIPGGKGGMNHWTINGKSYPQADPIVVHEGRRYRLIFDNQSDDAHPLHLHRHSFELTKVKGKSTSGIRKDTVMVKHGSQVEVDFVADNPGASLLHCHQQLHMDFGFMTLVKYA
ncbi:MAG TPA: multicopper oxidase domain-containing protein [Candidatus Acidoferrum sp.]|nr:multicopper oxidase domain-containing protein [Candidatus Acidoferrum sp.]